MILINLLPHREAARKRRKEQFAVSAVLAASLGGVICVGVYSWLQGQVDDQKSKNNFLRDATAKLDEQIKDIAGLQSEILALKARQSAVEDLQSDRNAPVNLMNELVQQTPDGIYVSSMKQENQTVSIGGVAQSQERVSEMLRNFATNSKWLVKPELVEIVAGVQSVSSKEQRKVYNFTMRAGMTRSGDGEKKENESSGIAVEAKP